MPRGDGRAIEALARYCLRTSVSLTRPCLTADSSTVDYLAGGSHDDAPGQTLDALQLLARVLSHIPDPKADETPLIIQTASFPEGRQTRQIGT